MSILKIKEWFNQSNYQFRPDLIVAPNKAVAVTRLSDSHKFYLDETIQFVRGVIPTFGTITDFHIDKIHVTILFTGLSTENFEPNGIITVRQINNITPNSYTGLKGYR